MIWNIDLPKTSCMMLFALHGINAYRPLFCKSCLAVILRQFHGSWLQSIDWQINQIISESGRLGCHYLLENNWKTSVVSEFNDWSIHSWLLNGMLQGMFHGPFSWFGPRLRTTLCLRVGEKRYTPKQPGFIITAKWPCSRPSHLWLDLFVYPVMF